MSKNTTEQHRVVDNKLVSTHYIKLAIAPSYDMDLSNKIPSYSLHQ